MIVRFVSTAETQCSRVRKMVQNQIVSFLVIFGMFWQILANSPAPTVSTQNKMTIDVLKIQQPDIGSNAETNASNCKCPDNVDLNEKKSNGEIEYNKLDSKSSFVCCKNCVSVISAPLGYQVEVTKSYVQFQNDSKASLTIRNGKGNDGPVLGKLDNKNNPGSSMVSLANTVTVTLSTRNTASRCRKVYYIVVAKLKKLPTSSSASHSLSSDQPFHLITNKGLNSSSPYWTVTAETGKQVHLHLYGSMNDWAEGSILVIDGTDVNGKIISQVTQLSAASNGPLNATSSSGGSLTVVLKIENDFYSPDINFLFTQLENDRSQCGTSKLVFLTSSSIPAANIQISNNGGGTASCPAVLIAYSHYSRYPGMQLSVSSLQGSMVLYGGVDYRQSSNNEIIRFSSSDKYWKRGSTSRYSRMNDVISPMKVAGRVFLVLLTPGSMINFNFQWSSSQCKFCTPPASPPSTSPLSTSPPSTSSPSTSPPTTSPPGKSSADSSDLGSHGLSTTWICVIVVAATVVIAVAALLLQRSKLRSQLNNANSTVQPVYFVPSQPSHGDAPPSYEEAIKQDAPTASTCSNRNVNVIIHRTGV